MNETTLSNGEKIALGHLVDSWNAFLELPSVHPDEMTEFRHAIHAAQRIILSRPILASAYGELSDKPKP